MKIKKRAEKRRRKEKEVRFEVEIDQEEGQGQKRTEGPETTFGYWETRGLLEKATR